MPILGIDIGFGFTKATDGKSVTVLKSIYGEATDLHFWADFDVDHSINSFHVTIDDKNYFVGEMAEQQASVRHFTLDQGRLITEYAKILGLTAAGIYAGSQYHHNTPLHLVSGLPVVYFKEYRQRFSELLKGRHEVTYHKPGGTSLKRIINIEKVKLVPQPLGSILNYIMNDQGKFITSDLTKQKVGVVDIGFRTTDFTILDRLRYVDRGGRTTDAGISKAFGIIANKLRERSGANIELYRLYDAIDSGTIKIRGKEFSFHKIRDQVFSQLASTIANDLDSLWIDDWDMDTIILSGGGSRDMAKYLKPLISGNVFPVGRETDPRLNNVKGYIKYGRHLWKEAVPPTKPTSTPAKPVSASGRPTSGAVRPTSVSAKPESE